MHCCHQVKSLEFVVIQVHTSRLHIDSHLENENRKPEIAPLVLRLIPIKSSYPYLACT